MGRIGCAVLLVASCLVAALLAGCASDASGAPGANVSPLASPDSNASPLASPDGVEGAPVPDGGQGEGEDDGPDGSPGNHAPTARMRGVLTNPNRSLPLRLDLELAGNDTDGDALAWTLTFGDGNATNGTSLPARTWRDYGPGNHTVTFQVSDGKASTWANLTFRIGGSMHQVVDKSVVAGNLGCLAPPSRFTFESPLADAVWAEWPVERVTLGKPFKVTVASLNPTGTEFSLAYYDDAGSLIPGSGGTGLNALTGIVAPEAAHGLVLDCGGLGTVNVHYEAGPGIA